MIISKLVRAYGRAIDSCAGTAAPVINNLALRNRSVGSEPISPLPGGVSRVRGDRYSSAGPATNVARAMIDGRVTYQGADM